jgi:hypothetical protein
LGHRKLKNTEIHARLISFEVDEYDVKVAENKQEITKLLEVGFEWVGQDNNCLTCVKGNK